MAKFSVFLLIFLIVISSPLQLSNFSVNFFKIVAQSETKNFVISPASLALATGLVLHGATGETRRQIEKALGDSGQLQILANQINADKTIESGNKIFINQKFSLKENYQQSVRRIFDVEAAERVNFSAKDETASKINNWISERTKGLIKDMIKADSLRDDIAAMLINAIYFKGAWELPFGLKEHESDFWVSKEINLKLNFMGVDEHLKYAKLTNEKVNLIELPYKNSRMSMIILVPTEKEGLGSLEESLTENKLTDLMSKMRFGRSVFLSMPRFKIEFEKSLNDAMKELGMSKMFSSGAELEELIEGPGLAVDEVLQRALIDVNENGTEAAAATVYKAYPFCGGCGPEYFEIDQPFLFLLKNEDFVFFMGRVVEPKYD